MPKVKEVRYCIFCSAPFHRSNGNVAAKYCSRLCACRVRNTPEHQRKAGKAGGAHKIKLRGTGKRGYIKEFGIHQHRVRIEKFIGRKLRKDEVIHHKNGNKHDNRLENLQIVTRSEHFKIHLKDMKCTRTRSKK